MNRQTPESPLFMAAKRASEERAPDAKRAAFPSSEDVARCCAALDEDERLAHYVAAAARKVAKREATLAAKLASCTHAPSAAWYTEKASRKAARKAAKRMAKFAAIRARVAASRMERAAGIDAWMAKYAELVVARVARRCAQWPPRSWRPDADDDRFVASSTQLVYAKWFDGSGAGPSEVRSRVRLLLSDRFAQHGIVFHVEAYAPADDDPDDASMPALSIRIIRDCAGRPPMSCDTAGCTHASSVRLACCRARVCIYCYDAEGFWRPQCTVAGCPAANDLACPTCRRAYGYECAECGETRCDPHNSGAHPCQCDE